jgi:2-keto-4-pentenoate hydratase
VNKKYGPVIGYKAGLTITAVQKKFGVSHPPGQHIIRNNGTAIDAKFDVQSSLW